MSEISLDSVKLKNKKRLTDMAKIQLKSANINPFGGLFSIFNQFDRSDSSLPLRGVSTPGHGQGEGPVDSKLSRSDDADDDGRGRSERSERSPLRGKLLPLRSFAPHKKRGGLDI